MGAGDGQGMAGFHAATARDRRFLGHPRGLAVLAGAEAWERFSYAGMQALLTLYAAHELFRPDRIGRVWGIGGYRAAWEWALGPLGAQGLASVTFGLYAGGVYLTPLLGGWLADRVVGRTPTVVLGALLLTAGHGLMGWPAAFLPALSLLVLGVGCFKTNLTAQVGDLYGRGDARRARAFQLFVMGIAGAAFVAPLVCGTLGERVDWAWGFGAAGIGMAVALATYLAGRRWLPPDPGRRARAARAKLAPAERRRLAVLVALLPVLALGQVGNEQVFNAYLLWAERSYRLSAFGWPVPVTWLVSLTGLMAVGAMGASLLFWRWWAARRREPDELAKLCLGTAVAAAAPLVPAAIAAWAPGRRVGLGWALLFHGVNELGIANLYPIGLALYSRCAPPALGGVVMALFYLNLFLSNLLVGRLGALLGRMPDARFWLLHAALMAGAAAALLLVRGRAGRLLAPTHDPEPVP